MRPIGRQWLDIDAAALALIGGYTPFLLGVAALRDVLAATDDHRHFDREG